jgi:asparagine synthase (glutamine-hydrolysing)
MSIRYIALIDDVDHLHRGPLEDASNILGQAGLRHQLCSGPVRLFTSAETPVLLLRGGGAIVGDLFTREGVPIRDVASLPEFASSSLLREHILQRCWGEYLLIQTMTEADNGVVIMRDPSGGIPCVYSLAVGAKFVTSDISLTTRLGLYQKSIDWDSIAESLLHPHLKRERTGLVGIRELLPGCSLRIHAATAVSKMEWSPWRFVASDLRHNDPREAAADVRKAVRTVVRALAETDKSVLLELSGGLDSSIVGANLRDTPGQVTCCTLVTPVPGADERQYAKLIADELGVRLEAEYLSIDDARFCFALAASSVAPRIGALQYAIDQVIDAVGKKLHIGSFFSGGGGDTVFCYLKGASPAADAFKERGLAAGIRAVLDLSELHQCTLWKAGRLTLRKLWAAPKAASKPDTSFLAHRPHAGPSEDHPWFAAPIDALPGDRERIIDLAGTQVFRDLLPRGETKRLRMPLLSQPVFESCLKAPCWMWIAGGRDRAVARSAFEDLLPPGILNRRSKGTFVSYSGAIYRQNKDQIREFLLGGHLEARGLLDASSLRLFFEQDLASRDLTFMRIFELCMIENWVRHQSQPLNLLQ